MVTKRYCDLCSSEKQVSIKAFTIEVESISMGSVVPRALDLCDPCRAAAYDLLVNRQIEAMLAEAIKERREQMEEKTRERLRGVQGPF